MFKTTSTIVLAALCLNFSPKAQAQTPENKAVDITAKGLQIGQKVPITVGLAKYKGKLIILDFWATWCSPCIAMIPEMETLQAQFKDEIQILPVTYQSEQEVTSFLAKLYKGKIPNLSQITGDKELHKLFPHLYLPHYVWIDGSGTVKAITGYKEINAENIKKALKQQGNSLALKQKKDLKMELDRYKPFLINGNGGDGSSLQYHSLFTTYTEGIGMGVTVSKDSLKGMKILLRNQSPAKMFRIAFGGPMFETARTIVNVKEPDLIKTPEQGDKLAWSKAHNLCYELLLPPHLAAHPYTLMQQDLLRYFPQYTAAMQVKKVTCMVLKRTSKVDKIKSKGGSPQTSFGTLGCKLQNFPITRLVDQLRLIYQQLSIYPMLDETDYKSPVDLEINANLQDMDAINQQLLNYDLQFIKQSKEIPMLVISDKN